MSVNGSQDQSLLARTHKLRNDLLDASVKLSVYAEALTVEAHRLKVLAEDAAADRAVAAQQKAVAADILQEAREEARE